MSRHYLNVVFLCSETVGQLHSLELLLDALQQVNYEVSWLGVGDTVTERFAFWKHYDEQARKGFGIAYSKHHLSFFVAENVVGGGIILNFEIRWRNSEGNPSGGTAWPWHLWRVKDSGCNSIVEAHSKDTAMFTQRQWNPEGNAQRLLELATVIYNTIHPRFAWIERCHWKGYTTPEDVDNLLIPHVYWANFFSPAYVHKYGESFLMDAPGWSKEQLEDGGILYVLTPSLVGTGPKTIIEEVKRYFKIDFVRRRK